MPIGMVEIRGYLTLSDVRCTRYYRAGFAPVVLKSHETLTRRNPVAKFRVVSDFQTTADLSLMGFSSECPIKDKVSVRAAGRRGDRGRGYPAPEAFRGETGGGFALQVRIQ